jgi:hypothetical protein
MKTTVIAIAFLLVGAVIGGYLALGVGAGMGAGAGIVVGSQTGACLAVKSAKDQGLLTSEQVAQVLTGTIARIQDNATLPADAQPRWVASEADCENMIAEMKRTAQDQK